MKVLLVNHSDTLGGASIVTYRLLIALRAAGIDAKMLVMTKTSDSPYVTRLSSRFARGFKFMGECIACAQANGWHLKDVFKISVGATGFNIARHPLVKEADVICLNWVNQGMLSINDLKKLTALGKPIVWTMHDMWPITGVCHHSGECHAYRHGCGFCPMLHHGQRKNDMSFKLARIKSKIYSQHAITFVPVSNWLADKAKTSWLLSGQNIKVIPNAFPVEYYMVKPLHLVREFDIDYSRKLILMGAARLDDPVKGLDYAIDALNLLFDSDPKLANSALMVFFGDIHNINALRRLRFPYRHIGYVNDSKLLRQLFAAGSVVLSTSLYETLPGTLIEGQASGCVPVTFGNAGQTDIVDHLRTGYIAQYRSAESLADGIKWALNNPIDRQLLHDNVVEKFSSEKIAQHYIDLFHSLLDEKKLLQSGK